MAVQKACTRCRSNPPAQGKRHCAKCLATRRRYAKVLRAERTRRRRCQRCNTEMPDRRHTRCVLCRAQQAKYKRAFVARRKQECCCVLCGCQLATDERVRCERCKARRRQTDERYARKRRKQRALRKYSLAEVKDLSYPSEHAPGSRAKVELLALRRECGLPLWQPGDVMSLYAQEAFAALNGMHGG